MTWREVHTKSFSRDVKAMKSDAALLARLHKKMDEILTQPEHYPPKRYDLKGVRGAHVGSFVVLFAVEEDAVVFLRFQHHDTAYK